MFSESNKILYSTSLFFKDKKKKYQLLQILLVFFPFKNLT